MGCLYLSTCHSSTADIPWSKITLSHSSRNQLMTLIILSPSWWISTTGGLTFLITYEPAHLDQAVRCSSANATMRGSNYCACWFQCMYLMERAVTILVWFGYAQGVLLPLKTSTKHRLIRISGAIFYKRWARCSMWKNWHFSQNLLRRSRTVLLDK